MQQSVHQGVPVGRDVQGSDTVYLGSSGLSTTVQAALPFPPLPTHAGRMEWDGLRFGKAGYTADQMREYVLADRVARGVANPRRSCGDGCNGCEECTDYGTAGDTGGAA